MRLLLSESAFLSMIVSAAEVYKRECYGFLLGHASGSCFRVHSAIALQDAERNYTSVTFIQSKAHQLYEGLHDIEVINAKVCGEFHSHAQYGDAKPRLALSSADKDSDLPTQIIMTVRDASRRQPWATRRGILSGTLGDKLIRMKAYFNDNGNFRVIQILAPWMDR